MNQHIFFENIGKRQQHPHEIKDDPTYLHNCIVLEMATNWPLVRLLINRFRNQQLKEVNPLERDWLNFVLDNKVSVEKYGEDDEKFIDDYFKKPK